jgi:hypothetical protein
MFRVRTLSRLQLQARAHSSGGPASVKGATWHNFPEKGATWHNFPDLIEKWTPAIFKKVSLM